ncbi:MAG: ATP-binding protein, partial [Candidatus Diapherotrites archaeon]|nr:ATP-binding protein [Candidatus Diapherotrites archaeon]
KLIALVTNVKKTNRYFEHVEAVKEYSVRLSMEKTFPVQQWEFTVVVTKPLVIWKNGRRHRPTTPPPPGTKVYIPDPQTLSEVIGFSERGLNIGTVQFHDVEVKLDLTELFQKHLAILAMSGAGKSYLTSVIIEELLDRPREHGRPAVVVFDVHGEYTGFGADDSPYRDRTLIFDGNQVSLSLPNMGVFGLKEILPGNLTDVQYRELSKVIERLQERYRSGGGPYDLDDLIEEVRKDPEMKDNTRSALLSTLYALKNQGLVGPEEYPPVEGVLRPGRLVVFNLAPLVSIIKKQMIVTYFLRRMFELRRRNEIPPTVAIVEEAHNFAPEQVSRSEALSRGIIETVAREGRKFGLSLVLISQRPVKLSTTALSQCNTHIILRMTNPRDLDHVKESSEALDANTAAMITTLTPGEALVVGTATYFPVFIKVRTRRSPPSKYEKTLEEMALEWEERDEEEENIADEL